MTFVVSKKMKYILKEMPRSPASKTQVNLKFKHRSCKQDGALETSPAVYPTVLHPQSCLHFSQWLSSHPVSSIIPADTCLLFALMLF